MVLMRLMITVLFVGNIHQEVCARVCYYGQEPDSNHEYRWSLADKNPADCSEFRLGGLNVKPHRKPYEVVIGDDRTLIKDDISLQSEGDEHNAAPCQIITTEASDWEDETNDYYTMSPERLEYTVSRPGPASLYLYEVWNERDPIYQIKYNASAGQHSYSVYLNIVRMNGSVISALEEATFTEWSRFWMTYIDGEIRVGQDGARGLLARKVATLTTWKVWLYSSEPAEWQFYMPCKLARDQ